MIRRWIPPAAALALAALLSCSRERSFVPGTYSLSGPVKLRGYYVDSNGKFAGTRIIGDADGVPVDLLYGTQVLARTTTRGGIYRFDGLRPGGYNVRARILPGIEWMTHDVTVVNRDVAVEDTLTLAATGSMLPVPNPFVDAMTAYFQVEDTANVTVTLLDLAGRNLHTFFDHRVPPALYQVSLFLPPGPGESSPTYYWLTYSAEKDVRAQLLVRESPVTTASAMRNLAPLESSRARHLPEAHSLGSFRAP